MYIFIYGTLKKGFSNHDFLFPYLQNKSVKFECDYKVNGYKLLIGADPYLVKSNFEDEVFGEIYDFNDSYIVKQLDISENWNYERKVISKYNEDKLYSYLAKDSEFTRSAYFITEEFSRISDNFISEIRKAINNNDYIETT